MGHTRISEKQKEYLLTPPKRVNLLEGSVRSGKTWISLVMWALFVASMPKDAEFLMVGKTLTTLKRNCLNLLQELEPSFTFSVNGKVATLYGHKVWLEGADNETSENKIRGMTLAGAYLDELTLIPRGFYYMTLSRLSYTGAKLFATTNPDSPTNYVYTDIIQNDAISKTVTKFLIHDNIFLEKEYIEELEHEYEAVPNSYQRYILGEWVLAEGLVYDFKDSYTVTDEDIDMSVPGEYYVSIDYGTQNPFSAGLWLLQKDRAIRINEYYYSGKQTNIQKTDEEYCDEVEKLCEGYSIKQVIVDPSAASFIASLRKRGFKVIQGNNDVLDGIRRVAVYLSQGNIRIHRRCKATIAEFGLYRWDEKSKGDNVVKENDHAMDDIRYFANTVLKHRVRKNSYKLLW